MKKTEPVFWIGSIAVSAIFAMLIIMTAGVISEILKTNTGAVCLQFVRWVFYFMAAGIFAATFRHLMKKKRQILKNYYLLSVIIAIVLALLIMQMILSPFQSLILKLIPLFEERFGGIFALALMYVIAAANVIIIILIFGFLTKKKSEYIRYISERVGRISESEDDVYIEEKGEDELAALSRNINQMSADLLENRRKQVLMENQKNELISNVSHDLRSPLTSIIGYIQLLKENGCRDEEKFNQYIGLDLRLQKELLSFMAGIFRRG